MPIRVRSSGAFASSNRPSGMPRTDPASSPAQRAPVRGSPCGRDKLNAGHDVEQQYARHDQRRPEDEGQRADPDQRGAEPGVARTKAPSATHTIAYAMLIEVTARVPAQGLLTQPS
jgi:hypothetical protein